MLCVAMAHFDLMRLYGQLHISGQGGNDSLAVPYMLKYRDGNLLPSRNTTAEVRAFIYDDLEMALDFMSEDKMVVVLNFQHIQYKLFVQGLVPISEIGMSLLKHLKL